MKVLKKRIAAVMAAVMMISAFPITSMAASHTITSVSIKVSSSGIEVGDRLPNIVVGEGNSTDNGEVYVYTTSTKYEAHDAEWVTSESKDLTIGEEPKMKVWLSPSGDGDTDYYFRGSYGSSNVSVSGGTFVSASKDGNDLVVTLRIKPIKGTYGAPADAYWQTSGLGKAKWEKSEEASSGAYEVVLYKGSSQVVRIDAIKATSYDFYPYMTKEGTYSFKVRTVPYTDTEKKYGEKSEWTESDEFYISKEHVSDGRGQGVIPGGGSPGGIAADQVGWIQDGSSWNFRYPDGTYHKNGWLFLENQWYFFNANGYMLTGWQQSNGKWYYLKPYAGGPMGSMAKGWNYINDKWYYMNPGDIAGLPEGAMVTGWLTVNGKQYYLSDSGAMVEGWLKVGEDYYYFNPGSGEKLSNTTIGVFQLDADGKWKR